MKRIIIAAIALAAAAGGYALYQYNAANQKVPVITINKDKGYQLTVNGQPYVVKGVCYSPVPIGKDYEYNWWGDPNKPWLVDGPLMKQMGVNTVRFYRAGKNPTEVRQVLSDLYGKFGIRVLMGDYLGFWSWPPPNYADSAFREKTKAQFLEMVRLYKDHPAILMWVLGNENNYSFDQNVQRWSSDEIDALTDPEAQRQAKAAIYYDFINEVAKAIKEIDPAHPVVMGVGEVKSLDIAKEHAPNVDVIGMISYRGPSFGNLFRQIKQKFDLPVILIEYGADSFNAAKRESDEEAQAEFVNLQWQDIQRNTSSNKGEGNALGGTLFEWNDEWWKGNENLPHTWSVHDEAGHWQNSSYHYDAYGSDRLNMNEEWWGVVSLDPAKTDRGVNARVPKKSYGVLKQMWTEKK